MNRKVEDGTTVISRIRKGRELLESSLNVLEFNVTAEQKVELIEKRTRLAIKELHEAERALHEKLNTIYNCL